MATRYLQVKVRVAGSSTYLTTVFDQLIPNTEQRIKNWIDKPKHQLISMDATNNRKGKYYKYSRRAT